MTDYAAQSAPGPRRGPGALFFAVICLIAALLHVYPASRLLESSGLVSGSAAIGIGVLAALVLVGCMLLGHGRHVELASTVGDIWLGVVFQLFVWTAIGELLRLVLAFAGVAARGRLVAWTVLVVTAAVLAWGLRRALGPIGVRRVPVRIRGLHADLDGLRLVQITDTHLSRILGRRWLARVVDQVNDLAPDVCVHTGDLADGAIQKRDPVVGELARVSAARRYYITGNHEYFSDAEHWGRRMTALGWDFLHNRHDVVTRGNGRLVLAGIDDPTGTSSGLVGHGPRLDAALTGAPEGAPIVLLAHQPKQVLNAARRAVDLQLAGHTHGGQMWPFHYLVRADQRYLAGLYQVGARTQLYVSRGTGFWGPPFRIGAPPEITEIALHAATG
ncbi:metallophosphoesterase [Cumulibacter manganitolerans]|uniref:metallophosphoesterase n=1 Tax=Cumulibacter manganitolerans TaxID=1884992 RepID=UPI00188620AB|nr:metallophosphoesterase [Cumulibacter manganitolerans]